MARRVLSSTISPSRTCDRARFEADWQRWTPDQLRPYLDVAFDCFGPDRLMIGSDWPVCTVASNYQRTMSVVDEYLNVRPGADRRRVVGENAMQFWKLEARELV